MISYEQVRQAADFIEERSGGGELELAIVLGSGLAPAVSQMQVSCEIPFEDVPHMPAATNGIHPGRFAIGSFCGKPTICMQGRIHMYEGYSAEEVAFPVFVMRLLGVRRIIVTNAVGAINASYSVEDFVLIRDHINFTGRNPLVLSIDERLGVPCPDMTYAYSPEMRRKVREAAGADGVELAEGVYIGVLGPSFETPAEIRAFRAMGADLVGMSTVCEVVAAASAGVEVLGVSLVTNMAAGVEDEKISADDIMCVSDDVPERLGKILRAAVAD